MCIFYTYRLILNDCERERDLLKGGDLVRFLDMIGAGDLECLRCGNGDLECLLAGGVLDRLRIIGERECLRADRERDLQIRKII